jgi:hypothetical protein
MDVGPVTIKLAEGLCPKPRFTKPASSEKQTNVMGRNVLRILKEGRIMNFNNVI